MALESCEGGELFDQIVRVSVQLFDRNVAHSCRVFASDVSESSCRKVGFLRTRHGSMLLKLLIYWSICTALA